MNKTDILNTLRAGKTKLEFIKADGSARLMTATLSEDLVPSTELDASTGGKALAVFDVDKNDWRSFRWDRLTRVNDAPYIELVADAGVDSFGAH